MPLLDAGETRDSIQEKTGNILGVADASIQIAEGEICVLMGLSGSGKSTLLRAVNRSEQGHARPCVGQRRRAASRRDLLRRHDPARAAHAQGRDGVSAVRAVPWRTVHENVVFGLELQGMAKGLRDEIVAEKLAMVGLDRWKDKYGHELSGGMQQRVGLARAFATDADILLMDEPFSALETR